MSNFDRLLFRKGLVYTYGNCIIAVKDVVLTLSNPNFLLYLVHSNICHKIEVDTKKSKSPFPPSPPPSIRKGTFPYPTKTIRNIRIGFVGVYYLYLNPLKHIKVLQDFSNTLLTVVCATRITNESCKQDVELSFILISLNMTF